MIRFKGNVNGESSLEYTINMGIPQGSILGPEIFLYLINDLRKCLRYCQCILFADDTTIYLSGGNLRFLGIKMQSDLNRLNDWLEANDLVLNVKKTKTLIFNYEVTNHDLRLTMNNEDIEIVNSFKFLGIWFDHNLSFAVHAEKIICKMRYHLYTIKNVWKMLNSHSKMLLHYAFISSLVRYGIVVYYPHLNAQYKNIIEKLYAKSVEICQVKTYPTVKSVCEYDMTKIYFDYKLDLLPAGLKNIFPVSKHSYNTRNSITPNVPIHHTKKLNESFIVKSNHYWSCLPQPIRNCQTKSSFTKKLKKYYIA